MGLFPFYNILLLEDDASSSQLMLHILERFNFLVTHVSDGKLGLSKVKQQKFDIIISDVHMPYMDGIRFLEASREFINKTPVIILTAIGDKEAVVRAAQSHVNAYLLKPVTGKALLDKIVELLNIPSHSLLDKRQYPFSIQGRDLSHSELELSFMGCPNNKSADDFYQKFMLVHGGRSSITNLRIILDKWFFLEPTAPQMLDLFLEKVFQSKRITGSSTSLVSPDWKETKLNLSSYVSLSQVNIISK